MNVTTCSYTITHYHANNMAIISEPSCFDWIFSHQLTWIWLYVALACISIIMGVGTCSHILLSMKHVYFQHTYFVTMWSHDSHVVYKSHVIQVELCQHTAASVNNNTSSYPWLSYTYNSHFTMTFSTLLPERVLISIFQTKTFSQVQKIKAFFNGLISSSCSVKIWSIVQ